VYETTFVPIGCVEGGQHCELSDVGKPLVHETVHAVVIPLLVVVSTVIFVGGVFPAYEHVAAHPPFGGYEKTVFVASGVIGGH
jgi:hypothetical protein